MRERINQAAKGIFEYSRSKLLVSDQELQIEVNAGETAEGKICVTNELARPMRGQVSSDSHFLELPQEFFQGVTCEIPYVFHGETLLQGGSVKGIIRIVTDCGTQIVSFTAVAGVPFCEISTGKIRDLFHFSNVAKENADEAATLFRSPHFEEVLLQRDNVNIELYRGLSKGASRGIAMEEFLIAIHKKIPIQLSVSQTSFQYENCEKSFTDKFVITKDNWGYGEYHIQSDSEFVVPERKIIWSEDFVGNTYSLPFLVDVEKMQASRNYARITVSCVRQTIEITVQVNKISKNHEAVQEGLANQKNLYQLLHLYLEFCMSHIDRDAYLHAMGDIVYSMEKTGMSLVTQLFRIHLGIMEHREQTVRNGLAFLETQEEKLKKADVSLYCACFYLRGLWADNDEVVNACIKEIKECYEKDTSNWKLLWFLLYLSPVYRQSDRKKYEDILAQLDRNCHSPVLFLEICSLLNDMPELLTELTPGLCEAVHWGCKQQYIVKDVALRFCYLAGRLREYSKVVKRDMCRFYEQFREEEILASICKMLMKGQITDQDAFYWYSLGVEHNLKLTDLYEYYMYSIDEEQEIKLSDNTLLYFLYDNHLTVTKKAMLYAYVIQNKQVLGDTYESYRPVMEEFALRQLAAARISSNLAVLYEEFLVEEAVTADVAKQLPNVMFCHEILCKNPEIAGVYVTHRELQGEEFVPLKKGRAVVNIFTENYQIFLADHLDNRYVLSIDYTDNKLLNLDHLAECCLEKNGSDYRLLLHLYDRIERMNGNGKNAMDIRRKVLEIPDLSTYYYKKSFASLVRYYYDNFEGEMLDSTLQNLDWSVISPSQREEFVEYCCVRRFFDKAMEGIRRYGYEKIDGKRLLKIASDTFARSVDEEDAWLVKLAWHIFQSGQFDENMMRYLCKYFSGGINEMVQLWRYAKGFEIDTEDFAERVLGQILFTGEMSPDAYGIFFAYYEKGKDKRLILGFIKFIAYHCLVHGWLIPNEMYSCFYREAQVQDNLFCLIASLKYLSQKKELTPEEIRFADYNINKLYEKKIVFPFYRDFYGKFALPIHILDQYYVEYTANPEYEVKIHYLISSGYEEGEYVTETMRDIFYGIRVKEFVLFQDETLQYYISESRPEGEVITKSVSVGFDETMDNERTSSRYHMLNLMMIAQEMKEEGTLVDMMKEYVQLQESVDLLFEKID
ncbi:MAG: DUF5717 family protein [Clostridiaceae bacterium]|nr:DUF5717 family protein [Clostridiaceae bacterium]